MSNRPIIGNTVGTPINPKMLGSTVKVPTKTSELLNDSDFATSSDITKAIQNYDNDVMLLLGSDEE